MDNASQLRVAQGLAQTQACAGGDLAGDDMIWGRIQECLEGVKVELMPVNFWNSLYICECFFLLLNCCCSLISSCAVPCNKSHLFLVFFPLCCSFYIAAVPCCFPTVLFVLLMSI